MLIPGTPSQLVCAQACYASCEMVGKMSIGTCDLSDGVARLDVYVAVGRIAEYVRHTDTRSRA